MICNDGNNNPYGVRQENAPEEYSDNLFYPAEKAVQKAFNAYDEAKEYVEENWRNGVDDAGIIWGVYSAARDIAQVIIEPNTKIVVIAIIDVAFIGWTVGRRIKVW